MGVSIVYAASIPKVAVILLHVNVADANDDRSTMPENWNINTASTTIASLGIFAPTASSSIVYISAQFINRTEVTDT